MVCLTRILLLQNFLIPSVYGQSLNVLFKFQPNQSFEVFMSDYDVWKMAALCIGIIIETWTCIPFYTQLYFSEF